MKLFRKQLHPQMPPLKRSGSVQYTTGIMAVILFAAMLFSPHAVFSGAEEGLLLWFQIIFPTLFPFMLISSLMLEGGGLRIIAGLFGNVLGKIFATSRNGAFAVLCGFLCGYPMGARVTADLIRSHRITKEEGGYLLSFCNNTSPVFIMNFIVWKTLGRDELMLPTIAILMGVPMLMSFPFRRYYLKGKKAFSSPEESSDPARGRLNFSVFDRCMMNSFEGIVKVGGYIIFFSILIALFEKAGSNPALTVLLPSLEVTNGILRIHQTFPGLATGYPLILGLTTFGGFCSLAQTQCMVEGTGLSVSVYFIQKLTAAGAASLLAYLYIIF